MALKDKSFPDLIKRLAEEHYGGNFNAMAKGLKSTASIVYAWKDGTIKMPSMPMVQKLGAHFGLDPMEIYRVVLRGKMLLVAVALGALASAAAPDTLGAGTPLVAIEDYVHFLALWSIAYYGWRCGHARPQGTAGR